MATGVAREYQKFREGIAITVEKKTRENYEVFKELLDVAENELHPDEFVALKNRWWYGVDVSTNNDTKIMEPPIISTMFIDTGVYNVASWQDIEKFIGELKALGVRE